MKVSIFKISILMLTLAIAGSGQATAQESTPVTTTRDAQGVWFIEGGDTVYDVYKAMGYAVASDRMFQLELYRRQARGKLSEVLGESLLGTDVFLRTIGYSDDELTEQFNGLSEDGQAAVQGYVDGINQRVGEMYANFYIMPYEYWIASFQFVVVDQLSMNWLPTPWTVNDAIAYTALFLRGFDPEALNTGQLDNYALVQTLAAVYPAEYLAMFSDLRWLNDPSAQTMIPAPAGAKARVKTRLPDVKAGSFPDIGNAAKDIRDRIETYHRQMDEIGARIKMGSYAWAISGDRTDTGNPMLYSGPQMGFEMPSIASEGSIRGGGLEVSGLHVPGMPGIAVGRTPHHAWSAQVGHAHTTDYFLDSPLSAVFHRFETINVYNADPVTIPVFRTWHGPIINPLPFNPAEPPEAVVSWAYANWGHEADVIDTFLGGARAQSVEEFNAAVEIAGVSHASHLRRSRRQHRLLDVRLRPDPRAGVDPRFPQIGDGTQEWTGEYRPLAHDMNTEQGYYGGWNNKASIDYNNAHNNTNYHFGSYHRAHLIEDFFSTHPTVTFEEVRDLALSIATTDGFAATPNHRGGNQWAFVADDFSAAVAANSSPDRDAAIDMLDAWDGHFVAGGPAAWRFGPDRADAWVLQDAWIGEVLRITFEDEFRLAGMSWEDQPNNILYLVLLRALAGQTFYDWFQDAAGTGDKPVGAEAIIIRALDNVIDTVGLGPYGAPRGVIWFGLPLLADLLDPAFAQIHSIPYANRSTYAHVVEMGEDGPVRIESMFPVGANNNLWFDGFINPVFDPLYFALAPNYDPFLPRIFPLFD